MDLTPVFIAAEMPYMHAVRWNALAQWILEGKRMEQQENKQQDVA